MRILKFALIVVLGMGLAACSSKSRTVEPGDGDNIPSDVSAGKELKDVNFDYDSFELSAAAKETLKTNSDWLKNHGNVSVTIEGHCDERGTNEYNMALGANRAQAVLNYMRSLGIAAERMKTVSYGEELPLDPGHNEAAWSRNRRAHFDGK